jgi:hypothetical protein
MHTTVASCTVLLSAIHAVQHCPQDQLLELIHQGGLITLLKGCMVEPRSGNPHNPYNNPDGPADAIDTLTELWTRKAAEVSRELYKRIEGGCTDVWCLFCDCHTVWRLLFLWVARGGGLPLAAAIDTLTELWTRKAADVSKGAVQTHRR